MADTSLPQNMAEALAAVRTVNFDGADYTISPLTLGDWAEFLTWAQDRFIANVRRLSAQLPAKRQEQIDDWAIEKAAGMGHHSEAFRAAMSSPEGRARLMWMGIRRNHPAVKLDQIDAWLADAKQHDEAERIFELANAIRKAKDAPSPKDAATSPAQESQQSSAGSPTPTDGRPASSAT